MATVLDSITYRTFFLSLQKFLLDSANCINFVGSLMHLLNTYSVPDPILSTEDIAVNKTKFLPSQNLILVCIVYIQMSVCIISLSRDSTGKQMANCS